MKSDTLAQLLAALGVTRSFSRPHVSDDNAYSESQCKTLKYQPDHPGRFESPTVAQAYLQELFGWHNDEHAHSGLALFTPADVFHGAAPRGGELHRFRSAWADRDFEPGSGALSEQPSATRAYPRTRFPRVCGTWS